MYESSFRDVFSPELFPLVQSPAVFCVMRPYFFFGANGFLIKCDAFYQKGFQNFVIIWIAKECVRFVSWILK